MAEEIKQGRISDLTFDDKNFNRHTDEGKAMLRKSVDRFGFGRSILVDKNDRIIGGNGVAEVSEDADTIIVETTGDKLVVVKRTDVDLDSKQGREMALADNATADADLAWDTSAIADAAQEWGIDTNEWGVQAGMPEELAGLDLVPDELQQQQGEGEDKPQTEVKEDDFDPDAHYETKVKAGEVWQLGEHRLMCGDSTDAECVAKLMNGERADLVFTDPPYGMKKESEGVLNDNLNFDDLLEFNKRWIPLTFANLKDNGSWYCWGIDEPLMDIYSNILRPMQKRNEITFRNLITWFKNPSGCGDGQNNSTARSYGRITEKCLFVMVGVQGFTTNAFNYFDGWEPIRIYLKEQRDAMKWSNGDMKRMVGHSETSGCHWFDKSQWMFPTEEEYNKWQQCAEGKAFTRPYKEIQSEYESVKREYLATRAYFDNTHDLMTEVWQFDRVTTEERLAIGHATPKPLALCARGIKTSSREGEIVLDVFGGSGSTMIACEQLGRKCRMMELDPHYCTVIIARWEKLTGQKAIKLNQ